MTRPLNRLERETAAWSDEYLIRVLRNGAFLISSNALFGICVACEAAERLESRLTFLRSDGSALVGAKAMHDEWRKQWENPQGYDAAIAPLIKPETLFLWENLHPDNRESYLRTSKTVLAAVALSTSNQTEQK